MNPDDKIYESLATVYPQEVYNQDPKRFCDFIRRVYYPDWTNEMIKEALKETEIE